MKSPSALRPTARRTAVPLATLLLGLLAGPLALTAPAPVATTLEVAEAAQTPARKRQPAAKRRATTTRHRTAWAVGARTPAAQQPWPRQSQACPPDWSASAGAACSAAGACAACAAWPPCASPAEAVATAIPVPSCIGHGCHATGSPHARR
ncbi:hypothetical protein [Roseisolibacter sp. H3M3-2]|uniref:hypothetical protein n=1 Tax=Roseisolibacter sp. H3M3-2 TaxID=3031323 RepID=UPI0023DB3BE1|nr:hypothetical protein [Roseisolibacter sp. H3M3-2]MDF1502998.1 hypothetical protein [Roseisolibacter sp. H3M3-2]